jgi:ubiquinone biosynthesis protein
VCEPIFERPLKDISFGQLLLRLFQTARRFNMEVQPQLVLLQKTLLNIEGLGRQLYPDLDLWTTAKPFLERWMEEQVGPSSMLTALKDNIPHLIEKLPEMPGLIYAATKKIAEGEEHEQHLVEMLKIRDEIRRSNQRTVLTIAGTGLLMGGLIVYGLDGFTPNLIWGAPLVSWISGGLGALILLVALQD